MLGALYFLLCFILGYVICTFLFPKLSTMTETTFRGNKISLSQAFILLPAWFVTGTVSLTWTTYILAYCFRGQSDPLYLANIISMSLFFAISAAGIIYIILKKKGFILKGSFERLTILEMVFIALVIALVYVLMRQTFHVQNGQLYVGVSVFSDFSPHLGMIRSFSHGNNFPTMYSHYTGEDIRYHFMFQFLAGNLEYLGMRLDWAFNLPSIVSLVSAYMLLYVLAVRLSGRRAVGWLAGLFFAFRCSPSFFTFIGEIPEGTSVWTTLKNNMDFISYTIHEDWGLWNLNVYANQRHLAIGMCALLLLINIFLPYLFSVSKRFTPLAVKPSEEMSRWKSFVTNTIRFFKMSFLSREGWMPLDWKQAVFAGILLGATAFWNGATLLATLMVLFILAIISDHRLDYLITAVITTVLSFVQSSFFIRGSVVEPEFLFGFICENKTIFGVLRYIGLLCGILPLVLFAAFLAVKGVRKYALFAFSAPFFFSFFVSLTSDVTVNHKYIMISLMLMSVYAAILIVRLFETKNIWMQAFCVLLVVIMTATGVYDFTVVMKKNVQERSLSFSMDDPLVEWLDENTDSHDIFLTASYALSRPVIGGAMLFEGHAYYPMTAGYNTEKRDALVKAMYEAKSSEELIRLINENKITHVIIDIDTRESQSYELNEALFDQTYEKVYTEGSDQWMLSIYDTSKICIN